MLLEYMIILMSTDPLQDARDSALNKTKLKHREESKAMEEASKQRSKEEGKRNK